MNLGHATCAISNLPIMDNQEVVMFVIVQNNKKSENIQNNYLYEVCPLPFYSQYSKGTIKNHSGLGFEIVTNTLKKELYESASVTKENFNMNSIWEAPPHFPIKIKEIQTINSDINLINYYQKEQLVRRLKSKEKDHLKQLELIQELNLNPYREVKLLSIHKEIFQDILDNFYLSDFKSFDGVKKEGDFTKIYFSDVIKYVGEHVLKLKILKKIKNISFRFLETHFESDNLSGQFLGHLLDNSQYKYALISYAQMFSDEVYKGFDEKRIENLLIEFLKGIWINLFMLQTRKMWTPQANVGSFTYNLSGYNVLIKSMQSILNQKA